MQFSKDELIEKVVLWQKSEDKVVRDKIFEQVALSLEGLVQKAIQHKIGKRFNAFEECLQAARIGIFKAMVRFDASKGFAFTTYVFWWINAEIGRTLDSVCNMVKVPEKMLRSMKKTYRGELEGTKKTDYPRYVFWDTMTNGREENLHDFICAKYDLFEENRGAEAINEKNFQKIAEILIESLPDERSKKVIRRRMGGATLQKIGSDLGGISRESVRLIEKSAHKKMRKYAETMGYTV